MPNNQLQLLQSFAAALGVTSCLVAHQGCAPAAPSPREQQIRNLSEQYGFPMDEVRGAMNRIEGRPLRYHD